MQRKKTEVPEHWLSAVQRPDGSRKKVVLYTTSASVLYTQKEQGIEKMKEAFRLFQEEQEQITVLWRPDAKAEDFLKESRPEIWEEYLKLLTEYKEAGWGIYDDSQDLERAVDVCDACYGDGGRAANMCHVAGKPLMIQDVTKKQPLEVRDGFPGFVF